MSRRVTHWLLRAESASERVHRCRECGKAGRGMLCSCGGAMETVAIPSQYGAVTNEEWCRLEAKRSGLKVIEDGDKIALEIP